MHAYMYGHIWIAALIFYKYKFSKPFHGNRCTCIDLYFAQAYVLNIYMKWFQTKMERHE